MKWVSRELIEAFSKLAIIDDGFNAGSISSSFKKILSYDDSVLLVSKAYTHGNK